MNSLLTTMFALGFLHGLGMDHVMAITTLVRRSGPRRAAWMGIQFGLGHMGLLGVAALTGLLLRFTVPVRFELITERMGGLLLVVLGIWVLLDLPATSWVFHEHPHQHDQGRHSHTHVHLHRHGLEEHRHSHLAWGLGAVFALSGVRSLLVMVPVVLAPRPSLAVACIALLGAGIVVSMSLFGWIAAALFRTTSRLGTLDRWAGGLTGLASLMMGGYWILR